jgi:large subunit ribosomal protein L11
MAKKIVKILKFQIEGGKAVPGQALGPSLGGAGINIGEFVKRFNDETRERMGEIVPTLVNVFEDRTYAMVYKRPPATYLIKKAAGIESGSGTNLSKKVAKLSKDQIRKIAEAKMEDLNANDMDAAMKIIEGSCRSMGVEVK